MLEAGRQACKRGSSISISIYFLVNYVFIKPNHYYYKPHFTSKQAIPFVVFYNVLLISFKPANIWHMLLSKR